MYTQSAAASRVPHDIPLSQVRFYFIQNEISGKVTRENSTSNYYSGVNVTHE